MYRTVVNSYNKVYLQILECNQVENVIANDPILCQLYSISFQYLIVSH